MKNTFHYGNLKKEIYMHKLEGFDDKRKKKDCLLTKNMCDSSYTRCNTNHNVYIY